MKRLLIVATLVVLASLAAVAQRPARSWQSGSLTWNDFRHHEAVDGRCSYLEYSLGIDQAVLRSNGVRYTIPQVQAFVDPALTWADTHYRSPALLRYNQVAFDMVELQRRMLQQEVLGQPNADGQELVDRAMARLSDDIGRLETETAQGADTGAIHAWEAEVGRRLSLSDRDTVIGHFDAPFRWGLSMDAGLSFMGRQLHRHFSHGLGLGIYADLGLRRHFLVAGLSAAGSRCRADALNTRHMADDLYVNDPLSVLHLFAAYGFAVVDDARFRVIPFVGYGLTGVFYTPQYDGGSSVGPTTGSLHFGVDFHRYISNSVEWVPPADGYNAIHDLLSVNARLFGSYDRFGTVEGVPRGLTVNLQVGIGFMTGRARIR